MRKPQNLDTIEPSPEEVIRIIKEDLALLKKPNNMKNFLLLLKKKDFSLISHYKFVRQFIPKRTKSVRIKEKKLIELLIQAELSDRMLRQGATIEEVIFELGTPKPVLAYLLRSYLNEMPKEVVQFKLLQYRMYQLVLSMKGFVKDFVSPKLDKKQSVIINGIMGTMVDMVTATSAERKMMDLKANDF